MTHTLETIKAELHELRCQVNANAHTAGQAFIDQSTEFHTYLDHIEERLSARIAEAASNLSARITLLEATVDGLKNKIESTSDDIDEHCQYHAPPHHPY